MGRDSEFLAALKFIGSELSGIRQVLDLLATPAEPEAPGAPPAECSHPEDLRVNLGGMGSTDEFFCQACQQAVGLVTE